MIVEGIDLSNLENVSFYCKKIKAVASNKSQFIDKKVNDERNRKSNNILKALMKLYPEEFL